MNRRISKTMKRFVAICLLVVCVALPLISWGGTAQCPYCSKPCPCTYTVKRTDNGYVSHTNTLVGTYQCETCRFMCNGYPTSTVMESTHPYTRTYMGSYDLYACSLCNAQIWAPHTHKSIKKTIKRIDGWVVSVEYRCTECGALL